MKKHLLLILFLFLIPLTGASQSIQLWGTTEEGGLFNGGTLYSLNNDGSDFNNHFDFTWDVGFSPAYTRLVMGGDGYVYGITSEGGKFSDGVICRINLINGIFERVYELQNYPDIFLLNKHQDGKSAMGSFEKSSSGKLYGMASKGGAENHGTIFSFDPIERKFEKAFDFNDSTLTGKTPLGSLTETSGYWFYGMTSSGGTYNKGVAFRFNVISHGYNVIHEFNDYDGSYPTGDLLKANSGKLYGLTSDGGINGSGSLFVVNPFALSFNKLADFGSGTGSHPGTHLIEAINNQLYGITAEGGTYGYGTIFSFITDSNIISTVHSFDNLSGAYPVNGLCLSVSGKLYGTTPLGGNNSFGIIYSFDPSTNQFAKIHDFDSINGARPQGGLMEAPDGWLYGLTTEGGKDNKGVVYKINPATNEFVMMYQFLISSHGGFPEGIVQYDNNTIYGITQEGGDFHGGVMYRYDIGQSSMNELFEFREDLDQAYLPREQLVIGNDQKIYGVSLWHYDGGFSIFNYDPLTSDYDTVAHAGFELGENPQSGLLLLPGGKMYGTMSRGGVNDDGVIYSFDPVTHLWKMVYEWQNDLLGKHPGGKLAWLNEKIYGTTETGGTNNKGTIFSYDPQTSVMTNHFNFDPQLHGENPKGLIDGGDGWLYGMTHDGGFYESGTLYRFNPSASVFEKLADFDSIVGMFPDAALLLGSDQQLYGSTTEGGYYGFGTVFQYNPSSHLLTILHPFNYSDGSKPHGQLMEYKFMTGISEASNETNLQLAPNPASDHIILSMKKSIALNHPTVQLLDLSGRIFLEMKIDQLPFVIHTVNVPRGAYYLQVTDKQQIITKQLVIIQ